MRWFKLNYILLIAFLGLPKPILLADDSEIAITSPLAGAVLLPGQHVTVTVATTAESKIRSVYVVGSKFFFSGVKDGPPFIFDMVVPQDVALRSSLVAVGSTKEGEMGLIRSRPVPVDIQVGDDQGCTLEAISLESFSPRFIGEQISVAGVGLRCSDGRFIDVSEASATSFKTTDDNVATVDAHGVVTAVGPGDATISVSYKNQVKKLDVHVKKSVRGDLNGDGRVDNDDLRILRDFVGMPATCPNDARDLNHDGRIDEEDVEIMKHLIEEQNKKGQDKEQDKEHDQNK